MVEHWIGLSHLPAHGREFSFDDQEIWIQTWRQFQMELDVAAPLTSHLTIVPQPEGVLVHGRLTGAVKSMCHRCLEDAVAELDHAFDTFEAFEDTQDPDGEGSHLRSTDSGWELNVAGLLWEEFLLALPEKILCADTCLGLCPQCGKNRNLEPCICANPDSTSLLARALQSVKIKTN